MNKLYISLEIDPMEIYRRLGISPTSSGYKLEDIINQVCDRQYSEFEMANPLNQWDINQIDSKTVMKKKPYWEQKCPVCGELGNNASRGIPQQVWCKNNHKWSN